MSAPVLTEETLEALTPAQQRVWCALVVREKAIAWGGESLRFMGQGELSGAASAHERTVLRALVRIERLGLVKVSPRFVPAGWDGDEDQIAGRRDAWHPVRLADDYELLPDRHRFRVDLETRTAQDGACNTRTGLTTTTLIGSDRNG